MARIQPQELALNQGNRIYLYGLLARELGCGKQTFLPRVEEALATDRMTAEDLGFESTRALLEAMGDCVSLTVFKGGRVYATVVAQPAWDEALANSAESKGDAAAKGGKPWKRKKADKSLKPVKPRRVKRAVAEEQAEKPSVDVEAGSNIGEQASPTEIEPDAAMAKEIPAKTDQTAKSPDREKAPSAASAAPGAEANTEPEKAAGVEPSASEQEEPATASAPTARETIENALPAEHVKESIEASTVSKPTISLTVTYNPYSGDEGETVLEASGAASSSSPIPTPQSATDKAPDRKPTAPVKPIFEQEASSPVSSFPAPETAQKPKTMRQAEPTSQVEPMPAKPDFTSTVSAPATATEEPKPAPAKSEQTPAPRPESAVPEPGTVAKPMAVAEPALAAHAPAHRQPSPEALKGYPRDFAAEVYCPLDTVAKLSEMLPLGTSVTPLLASDFMRARELGLVEGTRSRATFPLRVQHTDSTDSITVTIRKQTGRGLPWTIARVE